MSPKVQTTLIYVIAGLVVLWYLKNQAGAAAQKAANAVNPTSDDNLAYTGVNSVGQAVTGDEHWTLGGWLYEVMNPSMEG